MKNPAPKIAEAVGAISMSPNRLHAKQIEAAMASAVTQALADGVPMSDSETIRVRMLAARDAVKQQQTGA